MSSSAARDGSTRRVLLFVLIGLVTAGLGAGAVAFRAYDSATQIDRRYPEAVLGEFLDASLVRRDDAGARLYMCSDEQFAQITALRLLMEKDEQEKGAHTQVVMGSITSENQGQILYSELQIRREAQGVATKELQRWKFTLVQDDGWRVCGAERLPDSTPTPSPSATQPTTP
jgi:hypothetical protein